MSCEYVREAYGVPAEIGRRVTVYGKPGVIAVDRGHYIGVNFDSDKASAVKSCHPADGVVYGEMGRLRKQSKGAARYARYLEIAECFNGFMDFIRWDARKSKEGERYE